MYHLLSVLSLLLLPLTSAHGSHDQAPILSPDETDWATRHMAEEHHIANLDPYSFFTLHDYDANGMWTAEEVRRTYGLDDESVKDVTEQRKLEIIQQVLQLFDKDGDGVVSRDEWHAGWVKEGKRLPDFGVG